MKFSAEIYFYYWLQVDIIRSEVAPRKDFIPIQPCSSTNIKITKSFERHILLEKN